MYEPTEFCEVDEFDEYAGLALADWEEYGDSIEVEADVENEGYFADFPEVNEDDMPF